MYVVKRCDTYGYGRNDWKVVFTSPDKDSSAAFLKMELRYVLEADPNLTRIEIDSRLANYYLDNPYDCMPRIEMGHNGICFSLAMSVSVEYQKAERPAARDLLDKILA